MSSPLHSETAKKARGVHALAFGTASAALYVLLAIPRLTAQGLYYDELHQAAAAFAWLGRPAPYFANVKVFGLPLLNMNYSGALKTAVYGLWLRLSGARFTPASWRACGIALAALGVFVCAREVFRRLPRASAFAFSALLVTDSTLLLLTRHDAGPVAFGLLLRLLFVAAWLRGREGEPSKWNRFFLGLWAGLAVFEKLSSLVLLIALAVLLLERRDQLRRSLPVVALGLAAGLLPLGLANLLSLGADHRLVSLSDVRSKPLLLGELSSFAANYLSLGAGPDAEWFILGVNAPLWLVLLEGCAVALALLLLIASWALSRREASPQLRCAALLALAYLAIGAGLFCLPRETAAHHWILGTPFQWLAIAFALSSPPGPAGDRLWLRRTVPALVALLLIARVAGVVSLERALFEGRASHAYSPALTAVGELIAESGPETVLVAAGWGLGMQPFCLAQGQPGRVYEFLGEYEGLDQLAAIAAPPDHQVILLAALDDPQEGMQPVARAIFSSATRLPGWRATPLRDGLLADAPVRVWKLTRDDVRH